MIYDEDILHPARNRGGRGFKLGESTISMQDKLGHTVFAVAVSGNILCANASGRPQPETSSRNRFYLVAERIVEAPQC
jgi:hypothetical protein